MNETTIYTETTEIDYQLTKNSDQADISANATSVKGDGLLSFLIEAGLSHMIRIK